VILDPGSINYDGSDAPPGTVICLNSGNYSKIEFANLTGTEANPIVIRNLGGLVHMNQSKRIYLSNCQHIRFTGSGAASIKYGIKSEGKLRVYNLSTAIEIDHVEMDGNGINIGDTAEGHEAHEMNDIHVHHCYIHDYGSEGIYIGSSGYDEHPGDFIMRRVEIDHNVIKNVGEAIQVGSVVEDCTIHHNDIDDVNPHPPPPQIHAAIMINPGTSAVVHSNDIRDCTGIGIYVHDGRFPFEAYNNLLVNVGHTYEGYQDAIRAFNDDNTIYNNTIVTTGGHGIHFGEPSNHDTAFNNIILDTAGDPIVKGGNDAMNFHHNLTKEDGYIPVNFGFLDLANNDYHLTEKSPAVDAGATPPFPLTFDLDDRPRPVGAYDVGAFELGGTP
jgi:hypothetical protein